MKHKSKNLLFTASAMMFQIALVFYNSAYVTSLFRKAEGKWEMVTRHNSIEGTLPPK